MTPLRLKIDRPLRDLLARVGEDAPVNVEIVPIHNRWRGLIDHIGRAAAGGVEYNVVDLSAICATLPRWLVEQVAARRDVALVRLAGPHR